jgi:integrase
LVEKLQDAQAFGRQKDIQKFQTMLKAKLAIRLRNKLIIHLLFHLGLRRGEMLGLKARDLRGSFLWVLRHPDDPEEFRADPPNTKTGDRKLPVNPGLQAMWLDYVSLVRAKFPLARKHPYVIVNHRDGRPLCFPGLAKIFDDLGEVEGLPRNLTPHHLRHAWNEKFSDLADENGMEEAREVQIRAELMGWNPGTPRPTAMIYLRRKTKRRAEEISLQLQEDMMHPREGDNE